MAAACYHRVGLLLAEAGGQDGRTGLLATARDHSAPPTATATGAFTASAALRETVTELGMAIPGEREPPAPQPLPCSVGRHAVRAADCASKHSPALQLLSRSTSGLSSLQGSRHCTSPGLVTSGP